MTTPKVVLLSGAQAPQGRASVLFERVAAILTEHDIDLDIVSVRSLPTVSLLTADTNCPQLRAAIESVRDAQALVVATSIHRASFSGLIQSVLDILPKQALASKPVFPLAVGGSQGQVVALDYTLRPLLRRRGATRVTPGCFIPESAVGSVSEGAHIARSQLNVLTEALDTFVASLTPASQPAVAS